jgi:hypothetical protein
MAETAYDPYAQSDIGSRALGGEYIDSMNFYWFDPVTETTGSTTEGWSRVPDSVKPYTYINPTNRNNARNKFYEMGGSFGSSVGSDGSSGGGGILSGLNYARSIAGGENVPSMIAPGMSYSMDQPMGYTAPGASRIEPPRFFPSVQDPNVGMTGADLGLPMGVGTPMPAGVLFDESSVRQIPEERPQTISPLGSLDLSYLNDIDFSGLLGTPNPQVDFPVVPPEVVASAVDNLPQDPILNMVNEKSIPITGADLGITGTNMLPEPSPPSLGASLFDNISIIPEAPEPMPLADTSVLTPESNVDINALQEIINNLGLLNEPQGIPVIPQIQSPIIPLLDANPQLDFPVAEKLPVIKSGTAPVNIPTYDYLDPDRLARRDAYFASM